MRTAAHQGKKDLAVRSLVERITSGIAQGDYAGEALAIYYWVCKNIRYIRDIDGVEFLKTPARLLKDPAGDCDDIATLLAAMLMAAGNPVAFAIASFKPGSPAFSHVYVELLTPHGPVAIDPVANRATVTMLRDMKHKKVMRVSGAGSTVDAGIGALRHMGPKGGNVYSVYDYNTGLYDYYEGGVGSIPATGRYRKPTSQSRFGASPEALAAPLPAMAKKIGSGDAPRGIIASRGGALFGGLSLVGVDLLWLGVGLGVGWYVWGRKR
jgi:hypothetical protein